MRNGPSFEGGNLELPKLVKTHIGVTYAYLIKYPPSADDRRNVTHQNQKMQALQPNFAGAGLHFF